MADPDRSVPDDRQFVLARDTWRQFHGLCLDRPAPTQPEIDARLKIYQRAHETTAMRNFGLASVLLAGIAKGLTDMGLAFGGAGASADPLLFIVTCLVIVVAGGHSLTRMRDAIDSRALARRVGVDSLAWPKVDSMFADIRDPDVRGYLADVRRQRRPLRRAEAAILYERGRGGSPARDVSTDAFRQHVRGRPAVTPREFATGAACAAAMLLVNQSMAEPAAVLPPLFVLGAWSLGDLLGSLVELHADPWELREGRHEARALRRMMILDLSPPSAIILAVTVLHLALGSA